jgi:hypothetical protein
MAAGSGLDYLVPGDESPGHQLHVGASLWARSCTWET